MKTCNDVTEKILSGMENDPDVMTHIADCSDCKELAENVKQIRLKPGTMGPSPVLDTAIHNMAVLAMESRKERPRYYRRAIIRVSAAAILAFCACVLGVLYAPAEKSGSQMTAQVKNAQIQTAGDDESFFAMEKELLSLSMEIQGTVDLFAQVSNTGSRIYGNY